MVIGPPRTGTTWASVWLQAKHDPLWDCYYQDLDKCFGGMGICCTGLPLFPEWVNEHPAPKVILHRPVHEIKASLIKNHLPQVPPIVYKNLDKIEGLHVPWTDLFDAPKLIYRHLIGPGFDPIRHAELKKQNIQEDNYARRQKANPKILRQLRSALDKAYLQT